ncbi:hypothetical protein NWE55_03785 [Myroides albus]|uniref:hypothetical protein n=1 Tax=Myroides albus TaxID=2562892 RepID=UPI0021594DF8|nr:hypothetical protein [Myroides albus]UVD80399.1 hypothetical protein NWE55_03785 [Myroides albus]
MKINIESRTSINNNYLGTKKNKIVEDIDNITYYYELNAQNEIETLSVRSCDEFNLDKEKVTYNNFDIISTKYKAIESDDDTYYFLQQNLVIWLNKEERCFNEILIYKEELSSFYKEMCTKSKKRTESKRELSELVTFLPYIGINSFKFDSTATEYADLNELEVMSNKFYIDKSSYLLRFDKNKLSQITIYRRLFKGNIIYNDLDLNKKENLEYLTKNSSIIERKGYWVLPEIGITISNDFEELFFFNKELLKFWIMINRPITSW